MGKYKIGGGEPTNKSESNKTKTNIIDKVSILSVLGLYIGFIVCTLIILITSQEGDSVEWYSISYHVIIGIYIILILFPLLKDFFINIWHIITKVIFKHTNPVKENSTDTSTDTGTGTLNFVIFETIINGLFKILAESINIIITLLSVIAIYSIVEETNVFKYLNTALTITIISLVLVYLVSRFMILNISSEKQNDFLGNIALLIILQFILWPLFFIFRTLIGWSKSSNNVIVMILIISLMSLMVGFITYVRLKAAGMITKSQSIINSMFTKVQTWSDNSKILKDIRNALGYFIDMTDSLDPPKISHIITREGDTDHHHVRRRSSRGRSRR